MAWTLLDDLGQQFRETETLRWQAVKLFGSDSPLAASLHTECEWILDRFQAALAIQSGAK